MAHHAIPGNIIVIPTAHIAVEWRQEGQDARSWVKLDLNVADETRLEVSGSFDARHLAAVAAALADEGVGVRDLVCRDAVFRDAATLAGLVRLAENDVMFVDVRVIDVDTATMIRDGVAPALSRGIFGLSFMQCELTDAALEELARMFESAPSWPRIGMLSVHESDVLGVPVFGRVGVSALFEALTLRTPRLGDVHVYSPAVPNDAPIQQVRAFIASRQVLTTFSLELDAVGAANGVYDRDVEDVNVAGEARARGQPRILALLGALPWTGTRLSLGALLLTRFLRRDGDNAVGHRVLAWLLAFEEDAVRLRLLDDE